MEEKADKSSIKAQARALRKKNKRIEESRAAIKAKSREKGKAIKAYQDRQIELEKNRDDWKAKCKEQEKERIIAEDKYRQAMTLLDMRENQLKDIMNEFEELKKKNQLKNSR